MKTDVVAIMFADLAGYTRRTSEQSHQQNAEMLRELAEVVHPLVKSFGGRVVKEIGDAVLSVFDAPTGAVRAAMAIQDRLAQINVGRATAERLRLRIAVNVGEVRCERGDVFGDAVNIASRIESETPADEIYISEATTLTMNRAGIPLRALGSKQLKGCQQPVCLYSVPAAPRVAETGTRQDTLPYLGRQLAELRAHLRRRRLRGAAAVTAAVLVTVAGGVVLGQAWMRHRRLAGVRAEMSAGSFATAADQLVTLFGEGVDVRAEVAALTDRLAALPDAASACKATDHLAPTRGFVAGETIARLRLGLGHRLIVAGELAQAKACLGAVPTADTSPAVGRALELSQIHLEALAAIAYHRGADIKRALERYEIFLRGGAAPADHIPLIAGIAAEGYNLKITRPLADSIMVESLRGAAIPTLMDRIIDPGTPAIARAWMLARLEDIAGDAPVDWTAIYGSVLASESGSTCGMRRAAVDGLRRLQLLRGVGLLAREVARRDRCTRNDARVAMAELIASGRVEPVNLARALVATTQPTSTARAALAPRQSGRRAPVVVAVR